MIYLLITERPQRGDTVGARTGRRYRNPQMTGKPGDGEVSTREQIFELLGNDTRMGIMQALWEGFEFEHYVTESQEPLPFSELKTRSEYEGTGNFNYHLERLTGGLVEFRGDGYVLSPLGYNVMRALDTFATFEYETVDESHLPGPCPFCAGELVASYRREILEVRCRDCGGLAEDGNFTFVQLESSTAEGVGIERLLDAGTLRLERRVDSSHHGLCWECYGRLDRSVVLCRDHDRGEDGICEDCRHRYAGHVEIDCRNCGTGGTGPLVEYAALVPAVRAAFEREGCGPATLGPWGFRLAAFGAVTEDVISRTPPTVTCRFDPGGETVAVRITGGDGFRMAVLDG